jgi:protein-disulfide isomerase
MKTPSFTALTASLAFGALLFPAGALAASLSSVALAKEGSSSSAASSVSSTFASPTTIKSGEHIRGRLRAEITLVEYADFQCPYCQAHQDVMMKILRKYRTKVSWMYRHYPLSFHPYAQSSAEASECVAYLGGNMAFWGFADTLMERKIFSPTDYPVIAKRFGVNESLFNKCLEKKVFASKVNEQRLGGANAGVEGTPTVFIVNRKGRYQEMIVGAQTYEEYIAIIERMLAENKGADPNGAVIR